MLTTLAHRSKAEGIAGRAKTAPEDFAVEEILQDGTVLEINKRIQREGVAGDFTHFVLQKRDWTTEGAIRRIAEALHTNPKRFSYAGSKDKTSVSTQLISAFRINKSRIVRLNLKDITILGAWSSDSKVSIGDLLGNRFAIVARGLSSGAEERVRKIYIEIDGAFPNYFGEQRFGAIRENTHKIGEHIVRQEYEDAAMMFLCDCKGETNNDSVAARRNLKDTADFKKALKEFPKRLSLERTMLEHLERYPNDQVNAFRKLPRGIVLLFIHAFQSYLFNVLLSERLSEGDVALEEDEYYCEERLGFPDLGYRSSLKTKWIAGKIFGYAVNLNDREKKLLERLGLKQGDFEIRAIPELSSKGTRRLLLSPLRNFSFEDNTFRFSLPAGSYATVALREFLDKSKLQRDILN